MSTFPTITGSHWAEAFNRYRASSNSISEQIQKAMSLKFTGDTVKSLVTRTRAIKAFEAACHQAGGGSYQSLKDRPFHEVMQTLAPNGITFVYDSSAHMNDVTVLTPDEVAVLLNAVADKETVV